MNDVVIQVENLSKQYRLGEVSTGSLHHDINRWWHRVRGLPDPYLSVTGTNIRTGKAEVRGEGGKRKAERGKQKTEDGGQKTEDGGQKSDVGSSNTSAFSSHPSSLSSEYVWALKDINFEVQRGEVLGIIGRNGAGKSTLLKILSRITAPTTGEVRVKGRIASLLEVGTGFHQDLTGRENIYLNGAVLGMTRTEIATKLDEIVEFSGCAAYLDTPVKRYSSGMVVRLGFAVAAHLDPEILIVDEVLAVGDAEFQKKCIGKMKDVSNQGRTILFVSHNMKMIAQLTSRCVLLSQGGVELIGETAAAIAHYNGERKRQTSCRRVPVEELLCEKRQMSDPGAVFREVGLVSLKEDRLPFGAPLEIGVSVEIGRPHPLIIGYTIRNGEGDAILGGWSPVWEIFCCGVHEIRLVLSNLNLAPGFYSMNLSIQDAERKDARRPHDVLVGWGGFEVISPQVPHGLLKEWVPEWWGSIVHSSSVLVAEPGLNDSGRT